MLHQEDVGEWSGNLQNYPVVPPFEGQPGVKADLPEQTSALQVFQQFFPEDFLRVIKTETNRYWIIKIT